MALAVNQAACSIGRGIAQSTATADELKQLAGQAHCLAVNTNIQDDNCYNVVCKSYCNILAGGFAVMLADWRLPA